MRCSCCKEEKDEALFSRSSNSRGRNYWCKQCQKEHNKEWMTKNKEHRKKYELSYRTQNKETRSATKQKWDVANKKHRQNYRKLNSAYYRERAQYRYCRQRNATPKWLTKTDIQKIKELHWLADDLQKVSGETYHVDHIVPILGDNVCGLHVPWNLQVLPADINVAKNNSFSGWA